MIKQTATAVLMVKPASFGFNTQTAITNTFQTQTEDFTSNQILREFKSVVDTLVKIGIYVVVVEDKPDIPKPDAIFPNNWFYVHHTGILFLFPMQAKNRRLERDTEIIEKIKTETGISEVVDLTYFEKENKFLEGTGSVVFNHKSKKAYAVLSERTNQEVLEHFCELLGYKPIIFQAYDEDEKAIYHTNVLMAITNTHAIICLDAIDQDDQIRILNQLEEDNLEIIEIDYKQLYSFAGNILGVSNGEKQFIIMSITAQESFTPNQLVELKKYHELITADVSTIEKIGGGGIRCMLAELF